MADTSPLAGLMDRAGHVFSLAYELGRAFQDEHKPQLGIVKVIDPTAWSRHEPAFNEFCKAVLDLRDPMQNPPDGFAPVAQALREAAQVAKQIRDVMQTQYGHTWQQFLGLWPHLNSVAESGHRAVREVTKARRLDDPFAFLDQPTTGADVSIDTTPTIPEPPTALVGAAEREIPPILANIPRNQDGTIGLDSAAHLVTRLQKAGHTLAAAQWAIHESVQAGRLRAVRVVVESPGVWTPNNAWSGSTMQRHGVQRGTKAIPKGKPAPFDAFKVVATDALWEWWRSLARAHDRTDGAENSRDASPGGTPAKPSSPGPGRKPKHDPKTDREFSDDWLRAKESGVEFKNFCHDRKVSVKAGKATLARVRMRKNRPVKGGN